MPANRTLAALLAVTLAAGCGSRPSVPDTSPATTVAIQPARPTQPEPPPDPDAWKRVTSGPITAEVVGVELRPVKVADTLTGAEKEGPECLIVRVRFTNSDDTFNAAGWNVTAKAGTDDLGNTVPTYLGTMFTRVKEAFSFKSITPDAPAEDTFAFEKPIPKAATVTVQLDAEFSRARTKRMTFRFAVPLPKAK